MFFFKWPLDTLTLPQHNNSNDYNSNNNFDTEQNIFVKFVHSEIDHYLRSLKPDGIFIIPSTHSRSQSLKTYIFSVVFARLYHIMLCARFTHFIIVSFTTEVKNAKEYFRCFYCQKLNFN